MLVWQVIEAQTNHMSSNSIDLFLQISDSRANDSLSELIIQRESFYVLNVHPRKV